MQDQESDPSQPLDPGPLRRARAAERAALLDGVLALSGERGYHRLTVERLADRAGIPVARFYLHFDDLGECFAAAYAERASALESALLGAGAAQASWPEGVRATLAELFAYATAQRFTARALLTQVYAAGGDGLVRHQTTLRRFSRRLERTGATVAPRRSPPPGTATFMIGAVEQSVRWRLEQRRPELLWDALPELMQLVVAPYLGDEAARRERDRPPPRPR